MATRTTQNTPSRSRSATGGRPSRAVRSTHSGGRRAARAGAKSSRRASPRTGSAKAAQRLDRYAGFQGEVSELQVDELLLQALETEIGGIQVYETAIRCCQDDELKEEWQKYLEQTRNHERILTDVFQQRGLDIMRESPGRAVVRFLGASLVKAMEMALQSGNLGAAQLVAAECVVLAETKDHGNWELIGECTKALKEEAAYIKEAHDKVEDEEDEHLYHTMGWCRELWLQSLGLPAVLPPPEESKHVKTAIGAAKAKAGRKKMLKKVS